MAHYFTSIKLFFTGDEQQTLFKHDYTLHCVNTEISNYELYNSPVQNAWQKKKKIWIKRQEFKNQE